MRVIHTKEQIYQQITGSDTDISSKIFEYALKIFVVISTLFYMPAPAKLAPGAQIEFGYMIQELFFRYGVISLFLLSSFIKRKRVADLKIMSLFLLYVIGISIFQSFDIMSRRTILNIFFGILFFKIVLEHIDTKQIKSYAMWLFWLLVANVVLCLMQTLQMDPLFTHVRPEIMPISDEIGFMKLKATLGIMAAVIAPFLFVLNPFLCLICLPLLYHGESSVAIGAFCVSIGLLMYFRMRKVLFFSILAVICSLGAYYVLFIDMPGGQFGTRFEVWFRTFSEVLKYNPFFGLGIGKFAAWAPQTSQGPMNPEPLSWIWAHNEYLQTFFEVGAIGLIFVLFFIKKQVKDFIFLKRHRLIQAGFASVLAIGLVSMFHFPFHLGKMAGLMLFLMAAYQALVADEVFV